MTPTCAAADASAKWTVSGATLATRRSSQRWSSESSTRARRRPFVGSTNKRRKSRRSWMIETMTLRAKSRTAMRTLQQSTRLHLQQQQRWRRWSQSWQLHRQQRSAEPSGKLITNTMMLLQRRHQRPRRPRPNPRLPPRREDQVQQPQHQPPRGFAHFGSDSRTPIACSCVAVGVMSHIREVELGMRAVLAVVQHHGARR